MKIALASDHGGYRLKEAVKASLLKRGMDVQDLGCHSEASVDYPDYAMEVALRVSRGPIDEGILICTTGIGMAIAANKYPRIRAALCVNPEMALMARRHNNANILVLGAKTTPVEDLDPLLDAWFDNAFDGGRHDRRVTKIRSHSRRFVETSSVAEEDPKICAAILDEWERQQNTINLIASENYISRAAREAQGSVMTNKYAEGYPRKRWYNGCEYMDTTEQLAIDRAKELFGAEHANVQPHCGSSANLAVYLAVLDPGDTILAMSLEHGGHLTHGHKLNVSGRLFNFVSYGVRKDNEMLDYEQAERLAKEHKPKLIVVGASAYPRLLDFERFRKIADSVGAMVMVDMAHIAGLVAARCHPDPVPYAEFVTTTTHKTLRGSRGGLVLCRKEFASAVDKQVFPGLQGGPLMHALAAKAVCFHYALGDEFKQYGRQIVANAKVLAEGLKAAGFRLVSGGTDNHLMLMDVSKIGLTGQDAATALDKAGLVVNKNVIPYDQNPPLLTSGVRLGTPMVTTRGMKEPEMEMLVALITDVLRSPGDEAVQKSTRGKVGELTARFPVK